MSDTASSGQSHEELLAQTRARIDALDLRLLELLNERSALSLEVGRIKAGGQGTIFKPQREEEILRRLGAHNQGPLPEAALRCIWREIFSSSRSLQTPLRVAYLGPEGTFSYFAGVEYLGHSASFRPCSDLQQVFEEVNATTCDLGVVPLENSLQGTVGVSFDLFNRFPLVILAEIYSHISHCLLTCSENFSEIRTVYSHPQPMAQCANWLRSHLPQASLVPVESTAAAARRVVDVPGAAAIGNGALAEMLHLNILARRIEDAAGNWTRFVIVARDGSGQRLGSLPLHKAAADAGTKTSLLFTLMDKPGSLSSVLNLFAANGINMRKLESRPLAGECWRYFFFADVEADLTREEYREVLFQLDAQCTSFRVLGSYPMGPQLDRVWEPVDDRQTAAAGDKS